MLGTIDSNYLEVRGDASEAAFLNFGNPDGTGDSG